MAIAGLIDTRDVNQRIPEMATIRHV